MEIKSIQALLDAHLKTQNLEGLEARRDGKFHPSSFGQCFRKQYWLRQGVEPTNPTDERTLRVFACGHLFHDLIQGLIPEKQTEVKVLTDDISGSADIVTDDEVIDIKSIHSKGFFYMDAAHYDVKKEKRTNWLQVATYANILGKSKIRLVFVSKDDLLIKEYGDLTANWYNDIDQEIRTLKIFWQNQLMLPPAQPRAYGATEFGVSGECAKYCCFRDKCFALENYTPEPFKKKEKR